VSTIGIMVDPLKVEAIVQFPPLCTIPQLQSLQGKVNFLWCFVANYVEITKGFMRILKKGVPFHWDEAAQCSFEALKHALMSSPLFQPPDYNRDFLLYLAAAESTIGMVLVQEDECSKITLSIILVEAWLDRNSTTLMLRNFLWQLSMLSNGSITIYFFARPPSLSSSTLSNMC
jgi:hypothetical protein